MQLVPIPTSREPVSQGDPRDYLGHLFVHWYPYLQGISRRSKEPIDQLLKQIANRNIQLALVWDEEKQEACALFGLAFVKRGDELIGEVRWLTGRNMRSWLSLLPDLERYFKDMGCVVIRPICRPGWSRMIKGKGYRTTHYTMEKVLA